MKIFDAHCDVLYKMFMDKRVNFQNSGSLQVNLEALQASCIKVQCFAIYVPESIHPEMKFNAALYMANLFYEKVLKPNPQLKLIRRTRDIDLLQDDEIGAVLTLEGCDAVGCDLLKLKTLLRLGVSSVGLTWNYANCTADGVLEVRGAGLSSFGKQVVYELNDSKAWCDVSHLSERGFWDVMEWADYPFASHSNCYSLCPNPRNLSNEQIEALIDRDSVMGITFVTEFLSGKQTATITDILRHLEHVCSLGGENHVGFGSDFDGTDGRVADLEDARKYGSLINELLKYYSDIQVEKFLFRNFYSRFPR
ncbi:dipeptidase [Cytobacillus firmus]|uniref:dipeptidase n=1 Tax=Cytobacillus firmus TaxID=1399 RepID=UPI0036C51FFD